MNYEKEATRNYNLYKKVKDENNELKQENKNLQSKISKNKEAERKLVKLENENKEMKMVLEEFKKNDFDILKKLDLDEYNLTSDDLRSERNKKYKKGMETKGHPLVPKLDFQKIRDWRKQQELEDGDEIEVEEEEEEEELLTENEKFFFKGSEIPSNASLSRKKELEKRKEDVIAILNKTYADEDGNFGNELDGFKEDEVMFHDIEPDYEKDMKKQQAKHNKLKGDKSLSA